MEVGAVITLTALTRLEWRYEVGQGQVDETVGRPAHLADFLSDGMVSPMSDMAWPGPAFTWG